VEISDKLSVQITKGQWQNNNTEICYWESYMLMLLPEATNPALPLLTCDHCMSCIKESALGPLPAYSFGWWLVLIFSERKVLLVGCWWLVCFERKVLSAGG
jgi:hypothetical protein